MIRTLLLGAFLGLAACAGPAPAASAPAAAATPQAKPQMPAEPANEADCVAAGGQWGRVGLAGIEACTMPSPTAGKQCTDSSECAGSCWSDAAPGSKAHGYCQPTNMPFGCHSEVVDGVVQPALCAD